MSFLFLKPEENQQIEASPLFSIYCVHIHFSVFFFPLSGGLLPVRLQDRKLPPPASLVLLTAAFFGTGTRAFFALACCFSDTEVNINPTHWPSPNLCAPVAIASSSQIKQPRSKQNYFPIGGSGIDNSLATGECHQEFVRISRKSGKIMFSGGPWLVSETWAWTTGMRDLVCCSNSSAVCKTSEHNCPPGRIWASLATVHGQHSDDVCTALQSYGGWGSGSAGVDMPKETKKEMQPTLSSRQSGPHVQCLRYHLGELICLVPHLGSPHITFLCCLSWPLEKENPSSWNLSSWILCLFPHSQHIWHELGVS